MARVKLVKGEHLQLDKAVRLKDMEEQVKGEKYHVEVDYDLRIAIVRRETHDIIIPFENLRHIRANFQDKKAVKAGSQPAA